MLDAPDDYVPLPRPLWTRLYQRFIDWLWFGPLTRDLYPRPYPTRLQSLLGLLADLFRYARAAFLPHESEGA